MKLDHEQRELLNLFKLFALLIVAFGFFALVVHWDKQRNPGRKWIDNVEQRYTHECRAAVTAEDDMQCLEIIIMQERG